MGLGGEQQVGRFLSDHHRRRVRVTGRDERHHRGIRDAEAVEPADPKRGVDHGVLALTHPAGADLVVVGGRGSPDVVVQLGVGADSRAWVQLAGGEAGQRGLPGDLATQRDGGGQRFEITVAAEASGVDRKACVGVGGQESDRARLSTLISPPRSV